MKADAEARVEVRARRTVGSVHSKMMWEGSAGCPGQKGHSRPRLSVLHPASEIRGAASHACVGRAPFL
jgi:hypothetical protein